MTSKEYYDANLKKEGEGICAVCGKPTKFRSITVGYAKTCGRECATKRQWQNSDYAEKLKKVLQEAKAKAIEGSKRKWKDPAYRAKMTETITSKWNDPEFRAKQHKKMKELWEDPEFRAQMTSMCDADYCKMLHEKLMEKLNTDEAFRNEFAKNSRLTLEKLWEDPDFKMKASERMTASWNDEKFLSGFKRLWEDDTHKAVMKEVNRKQWEDPAFREKIRSSNYVIEINGMKFQSSYEASFYLYCIQHGIQIERNDESFEYEYKGVVHKCTYDFNCVYSDGSIHKIEVKGPHIDGHCIYETFDDEQYAAFKQVFENHGVEYITRDWLESHGMPVSRKVLYRLLDNLKIEYKTKE